jgi:hypothetical protein
MSAPWHEGAYLIKKHGPSEARARAYKLWMGEANYAAYCRCPDPVATDHSMAVYSYIVGYCNCANIPDPEEIE